MMVRSEIGGSYGNIEEIRILEEAKLEPIAMVIRKGKL